jgi:hypothetical protein
MGFSANAEMAAAETGEYVLASINRAAADNNKTLM